MKNKRSPGGQPGNQNARKHGFYSSALNTSEICQYLELVNRQHLDPEIALIRLKMQSILEHDPHNIRAIIEGCRLLAKIMAARTNLNHRDFLKMKRTLEAYFNRLESVSRKTQNPAFPKNELNLDDPDHIFAHAEISADDRNRYSSGSTGNDRFQAPEEKM